MGKRIVILMGSPRKNGNSNTMANAFAKRAEKNGHSTKIIDCTQLNIGGCHACETCFKTGKPCSFDDDFNKIADDILNCDVLVFSMPVYWYSVPAQIKAVIDKMFSFVVGDKKAIYDKSTALITCCEESDLSVMDGVKFFYEKTVELMKWTSIGEVLVSGVLAINDIEKTDGVAQAENLADKI